MPPIINKQNPSPLTMNTQPLKPLPRPTTTQTRTDEEDLWGNNYLSILLYGKSGTGKTTLWGTFPGPITVAICSGGINSGELRSVNTPELRAKIRPRRVKSIADMKGIIDEASRDGTKTLVLDHVSGLQDLTLKELLNLDELPAQRSWGMASQQTYGQSTLQCKEVLRAMLNLSLNVVVIGQERTTGAEEDSEILQPYVGVAATPSLAGWIYPALDYICQTYIRHKTETTTEEVNKKKITMTRKVKGVEYCLRTEPSDTFASKFRVPKGLVRASCIVDPNYSKIISMINGVVGSS